MNTGTCLRQLSWDPPGPAPGVSPTWHQVACHLPVLSTLLATLARSGGRAEVELSEICFRDLMFPAEVDRPAARPLGLTWGHEVGGGGRNWRRQSPWTGVPQPPAASRTGPGPGDSCDSAQGAGSRSPKVGMRDRFEVPPLPTLPPSQSQPGPLLSPFPNQGQTCGSPVSEEAPSPTGLSYRPKDCPFPRLPP